MVVALKDFLRKNLKASGRKKELIALVFAARKMPELLAPDLQKKEHYADLLKTSVGNLPDPEELQD